MSKQTCDLINNFIAWNPDLYNKMVLQRHLYISEDGELYPNKWHLEDTVWTHVIMCLYAYDIDVSNNGHFFADEEMLVHRITLLCHDIGKVFVAETNHDKMKVRFIQHANYSIQPTIDFLKYLIDIGYLSRKFVDKNITKILGAISNHMYIRDIPQSKYEEYNNEDYIICNLKMMMKYDRRYSYVEDHQEFDFIEKNPILGNFEKRIEDVDILFVCGIPGVGKDSFVNGREIISYDDIRVEKFVSHFPYTNYKDENDLYHKAWNYCSQNKINFDADVNHKILKHIYKNQKIAICNTNLSRKSRNRAIKAIQKEFPNLTIGCVFLVASTDEYIERDSKRSKKIGSDVMNRMFGNMEIPTLAEGFTVARTIYNWTK